MFMFNFENLYMHIYPTIRPSILKYLIYYMPVFIGIGIVNGIMQVTVYNLNDIKNSFVKGLNAVISLDKSMFFL